MSYFTKSFRYRKSPMRTQINLLTEYSNQQVCIEWFKINNSVIVK